MSVLLQPIKFTDILSTVWTAVKLYIEDCYRYFYREEVTVRIKSGQVKGFKIASSYNYQYYNFLGIPYAKPPVDDLRFKEPQPFEPSTDDRIINEKFARSGSKACQADLMFPQIATGTEDCLHLSVFTHDIRPSTLKPCMVWIYGGGFNYGTSTKDMYNPEFLLRKQIVLISINYRVGAFGFLSLKDPELGIPGNAGLKDQVMALKWVKENCMHFGGDPDNITLFGESAGAASVSFHLLSNQSRNLFHKAILMSGTLFAPWSLATDGGDWSQLLAKNLGWNGEGGELACLRILEKATPHAIIQAQEKLLTIEDFKQVRFVAFTPVLEPYETPQCILRELPSELFGSAWSKHIPTIIGLCANEGLAFYKMLKRMPEILTEFNVLKVTPTAEFDISNLQTDKCQKINKKLENFYSNHAGAMANGEKLIDYLTILHDKSFAYPAHRLIVSRNKYQHAPTYLLRFDFESQHSLTKRLCVGGDIPGVCHGDDLSYYFRTVTCGSGPAQHTDEWKTIERMCEIFSAFAAVGDPNNQLIEPIQWNPCSLDSNTKDNDRNGGGNYKFLNISNEISYIDWIDSKRMQFWDKIYAQLGYNL